MAFQPSRLQAAVLSALEHLEIHGCWSADKNGKQTVPTIRFGIGVPEVFLKACVQADGSAYQSAIVSLQRRGLIRQRRMHAWPFPWCQLKFALPDGRVVDLERRQVTPAEAVQMLQHSFGGTIKVAARTRKRGRDTKRQSPTYLVEARFNQKRRSGTRFIRFYRELQMVGAGRSLSITRRGLRLYDSIGDNFHPDELVRLSQVAPLTGLTKRTLERYLKNGSLPRPDVRGGNGRAHKWYWSNIRPALSKICNRQQPKQFPGSRMM